MRARLSSAALLSLVLVASGAAQANEVSGKYVVPLSASPRQGWLVLRTFPSPSARVLTPRPVAGERRTDCCAVFSPDGSKLAFVRRTQRWSKLLLLDLEKGALRTVVQRPGIRAWTYRWSRDSRSLLHSTHDGPFAKVHRVPVDGRGDAIAQFPTRIGSTWPEGTSPDGSTALVVESKGGPLYLEYEGPDVLYAVGKGTRVKLASTLIIGGASWSPDGTLVAYTANCYSLCDIEVVRPDADDRRRLTRFRTRTSPFVGGYDALSFVWAGRPGEIVYGRGRTLYGLDAGSGRQRRIALLPCPRTVCVGVSTTIVSVSQERDVAIVVVRDECELDEPGTPADVARLYQVLLEDGSYAAAERFRVADDIWFRHSP